MWIFAIIVLAVFALFIAGRESIILKHNPLPRMENGDKRVGEINIEKTRNILFPNIDDNK